MPVGSPPSLLPFFEQAQQMYPTMNPGQQQQMARLIKNQQEAQSRAALDQARQQGMNQWHADQAAAGKSIQDIGSRQRTRYRPS